MKSIFEQFNDILADEDPKVHDYIEREEDLKILHEHKDGCKLVFASTPAHGYFGYVDESGELHFVGEEDEGIHEPLILEIFDCDKYGN